MNKEDRPDGNVSITMTRREFEVLKDIIEVYFNGSPYTTHDSVIERRHQVAKDFLKIP
jgi:hypothetical protein